jgi:hypothetical protein
MPGYAELVIVLFFLVMSAVVVYPAVRIAGRLGFTPLLGVLIVVPVANLALLWFVAFAEWPAARR